MKVGSHFLSLQLHLYHQQSQSWFRINAFSLEQIEGTKRKSFIIPDLHNTSQQDCQVLEVIHTSQSYLKVMKEHGTDFWGQRWKNERRQGDLQVSNTFHTSQCVQVWKSEPVVQSHQAEVNILRRYITQRERKYNEQKRIVAGDNVKQTDAI